MGSAKEQGMVVDLVSMVHSSLEQTAWVPWLRFSEAEMRSLATTFPEGQIVELEADGRPVAALSTVRIEWDGDPARLGSWDEVAGRTSSIAAAHDPDGSTLVLLSVSVRPDRLGEGLASALVDRARSLALDRGLDHVISPFRPSGFGTAKAAGTATSFAEHCAATRPDGLPIDPWLRVLRRKGAHPLKVAPAAMVVSATLDEVERWRTESPDRWRKVDSTVAFAEGIGRSDGERIEIWECGETGTWYLDVAEGRATYIEDNLWGEVPLRADAEPRPWVVAAPGAPLAVAPSRDLGVEPGEDRLVAEARAAAPGEAGVAVWLEPAHPAAEVVRELELQIFPDVASFLSPEVERRCRMLAVVDLSGAGEVKHCFRVSACHFGPDEIDPESSGMPMIDEVIDANPGITLEMVVDHYRARGVDLRRCIAVETNFRVSRGKAPHGLRWSDVGYMALGKEVLEGTEGDGAHGIFGHMNEGTVRSLAAIGVELEPFCGDETLRSPASRVGSVENRFSPLFVAETEANLEVVRSIGSLVPPSVVLEPVIDLRDSATTPLTLEEVRAEDGD